MKYGRLSACLSRFSVLALTFAAVLAASPAGADEQRVSRLGLAISAMVTSLSPDYVNDGIAEVNRKADQAGIAGIGDITAAPFFQAELRFFISDKLVAVGGVGKITKDSERVILPNQVTEIHELGHIQGVPRHIGLNYYFTPYTRGDFTIRPYLGGGFMDVVDARSKIGYQVTVEDTVQSGGYERTRGEGPGFYLEGGTHFMLPSRYSLILSVNYHNVKATDLQYEDQNGNTLGPVEDGNLDFSGIGLRFAVNMNLWNRF